MWWNHLASAPPFDSWGCAWRHWAVSLQPLALTPHCSVWPCIFIYSFKAWFTCTILTFKLPEHDSGGLSVSPHTPGNVYTYSRDLYLYEFYFRNRSGLHPQYSKGGCLLLSVLQNETQLLKVSSLFLQSWTNMNFSWPVVQPGNYVCHSLQNPNVTVPKYQDAFARVNS